MPALTYPTDDTQFMRQLDRRVREHFACQGKSPTDDGRLAQRGLVLASVYALSYVLMLSNLLSPLALFTTQVLFHFVSFEMTIVVAHDASHGAYTGRPAIDRWLTRVFDLVGINSHVWHYNHMLSHHANPNVPLLDSAFDSGGPARLHPRVPKNPLQHVQALSIPFIYASATLYKLFFYDVWSMTRPKIGTTPIQGHPWQAWAWLALTKVAVIGMTLVLPLLVIDAPAWRILAGFVVGHAVSGLALGAVFQVTHLADRTRFPEPDSDGRLPTTYARHVFETTADFCVDRPWVTAIAGGLNIHVAHHLVPWVSQVHLAEITPIVREMAAEYGMPYTEFKTVGEAVTSHLRLLHWLGGSPIPDKGVEGVVPPALVRTRSSATQPKYRATMGVSSTAPSRAATE